MVYMNVEQLMTDSRFFSYVTVMRLPLHRRVYFVSVAVAASSFVVLNCTTTARSNAYLGNPERDTHKFILRPGTFTCLCTLSLNYRWHAVAFLP
jgi:hypothetical protein